MPITTEDINLWNVYIQGLMPIIQKSTKPDVKVGKLKVRPRFNSSHHILDLHGMTLEVAYTMVSRMIEQTDQKSLTVITGKSGAIRSEFLGWMALNSKVRRISEINGGGAFRVNFQKKKI